MALLSCIVCGGKVASDAEVCPHCGTPNYYQREKRKYRVEQIDSSGGMPTNNCIVVVNSKGREYRIFGSPTTADLSGSAEVLLYELTGFDDNGNPQYATTPCARKDVIIPKVTNKIINILVETHDTVSETLINDVRSFFGHMIETPFKKVYRKVNHEITRVSFREEEDIY